MMTGDQSSPPREEGPSLQQHQRIPKKKKFIQTMEVAHADDDANAKVASTTAMANETVPLPRDVDHDTEAVMGVQIDDGKNNSSEMPTMMETTHETGMERIKHNAVPVIVAAAAAARTDNTHELPFDPPILRKGDLVRLSNEQRSGRIQGGLARITRVIFATTDNDDDNNNRPAGNVVVVPTGYDIEYVLGGKLSNLARCDLTHTTATAEGLVDATDQSRGHLLRRRQPPAAKEQEGKDSTVNKSKQSRTSGDDADPPIKRKPGRPPKAKVSGHANEPERILANETSSSLSKKDKGRKIDLTSAAVGKKPRNSKANENDCITDENNRSQIAKLGWETRRAKEAAAAAATKTTGKGAVGTNAKRSHKRYSNTDTSESDATSTTGYTEDLTGMRRLDIYTKQRKEMEKSLQRLEKVDRFGFFLDATPPEFDENYDHDDGDEGEIPHPDDGSPPVVHIRKNVQFPNQPPFNFLVVRKRLAAGRYNVDMVAAELNRLREIKAMVHSSTIVEGRQVVDIDYDELKRSMCNPVAVDWNAFNADIVGMCDAALVRDPEGPSLGSGHLGWAAIKIKKMMEQMYAGYGYKRIMEVEENEARERYEKLLSSCGNTEAAMQGKWRKEAFPERKYERLHTSSVICDGLSPKDRSYAMYELETKLPDSFVGLAYTYDDSGQLSEMWMKTVSDEHKKTKKKKKKKDTEEDSELVVSQGESTAHKAAMALAKDDGVVRAQVQTTMVNLLIQVQDRVMTDLGVMHSPEARSANWDDGDRGRDYRGGDAEVEQGTQSVLSLPEVAEQEVWGIDCYTRKNIITLVESEFSPEIAVEFVEKWLLPAINACPIDLAYKMSTAARILEGQDPISSPQTKSDSFDDTASASSDFDETHDGTCQPCEPKIQPRKIQESCLFLRDALKSKIKEHSPPWLQSAARLIRLASDSMDDDFFRIHPKGHGSVVIGEGGLKANSLVTYYRGEVYPAWRWCEKLDAIEHVQKKLNLRPNLPDFYNMAMERPKKDPRGYCLLFVDASRKSGLGSSFSHSCNPTCEVRVVSLNGKLSLSMTTLRDLEQGEELTFDYNAVTESLNEYRFAVCLCGHKKCRGSFLHYATADCYQQVLSRNSPISARFANLVRGCMKKVMSKEDSELLLKHGFNTAAFGAVSFNHHISGVNPQSNPDSIENVPVWLRTYVADCLRYIEYERRALPVALLCNQMERQENKEQKTKASLPKKENSAPANESLSSKQKSVTVSKPATSYFYFLQSQREHWESIARQSFGELKGLEFSQEVNRAASRAWSNLTDEEKMSWKKKSIADWKKNGGKVKAREEADRQRGLKNKIDEPAKLSAPTKAADRQQARDAGENEEKHKPDVQVEVKSISIADADAEGFSAMEQRIQQLAQSLSRIGRVLDRHRESVCAKRIDPSTSIDSGVLRDLVHCPIKIMSDEEVVSWIWSDCKGVVPPLFSFINSHFPEESLLRKLLLNTKDSFPVLSAFHQSHAVRNLGGKGKNSCTSAHARKLVREALMSFRRNIIDFLALAEKSRSDARNEKRREQARAREEQKRQGSKGITGPEQYQDSTDLSSEFQNTISLQTSASEDLKQHHNPPTGLDPNDVPPSSMEAKDPDRFALLSAEEVMSLRGGGDEASTFSQASTGFELNMNPLEDTKTIVSDAPTNAGTTEVSSTVVENVKASSLFISVVSQSCDTERRIDDETWPVKTKSASVDIENENCAVDVQSLLTLQQIRNDYSKFSLENASFDKDVMPCSELRTIQVDEGTKLAIELSPSTRLQELINAASSDRDDMKDHTAVVPLSLELTDIPSEPAIMDAESKKARKKNVPLSHVQVSYLKDWLYDPKHILYPYPTEEEKLTMMKDIGIDRCRLDNWFMKKRHRVLNPEVKPLPMKWHKGDNDHWESFRKSRYMLEATADLLLMYANTNTFFLLEPFCHFDSTPIDVYARELGNEVPRHFAMNKNSLSGNVATTCGESSIEEDNKGLNFNESVRNTMTSDAETFCPPDEVIDSVTVDYTGEYVVSQLLLWFNGGIGQKKGLPDLYGCAMLPPIAGCWEEITCSEIKRPNHTRWNQSTTTEYDAVARPKLAKWVADRYQRGSPWERELAKYFCPVNQVAPDPNLPVGSPVLDYLVTGIDENIQHVSSALQGNTSTTEQGKSKKSASDRLQLTVDDGMPAQAVANWVQCENPSCLKWRKLPWHVDVDLLPEKFFCKDNIWNPKSQHCDASEDEWDMGDAPIKFDTNDTNFEVGAWFDVQREGKVGYHEAQVVELDLESNVKRIKFHFWKLPTDRDEWIAVGSPRIAPHHSYTPRPLEGYSSKSKRNPDNGNEATKEFPGDHRSQQSNVLRPDNKRNPDKSKASITSLSCASATVMPQKRKINESDEMNPIKEGTPDEAAGFALFPKPIIEYLNEWMIQHADDPYPTPREKSQIIADTGLTKKQIGDWMARTRRKLKTKPLTTNSANEKEPNDLMIVDSDQSNPANIENLLLDFRKQASTPGHDIPVGVAGPAVVISENPSTDPENLKQPTSIKELENFMKTWLTSPEGNLFPNLAQKETIIAATGIDKKRLEGWFFRARKKIKKQESIKSNENTTTHVMVEPSALEDKERVNEQNAPAGSLTRQNMCEASTDGQAISVNAASQSFSSSPESLNSHMNASKKDAATSNGDVSEVPSLQCKGLTSEAKDYLSRWLSEHSANPYPTREEKNVMKEFLGISNERKLEGWFCRARKHQKRNDTSEDQDSKGLESKKKNNHCSTESIRTPGLDASGSVDSTSQESDFGPLALSSNFASLLSAAKSELSEDPWSSYTQCSGENSISHQAGDSQHHIKLPQHCTTSEGEYHRIGGKEQAITLSFPTSNLVDTQDRSSHDVYHVPYQQPQHDEQPEYPPYQLRASPVEYPQYSYSSGHSSYPENYPAEYSSYHRGESFADKMSYNSSSQGQMRASPADYMHESALVQAHATAGISTVCPQYQRIGDRQQVQHFSYPHHQHDNGPRFSDVEENGFNQSHASYEQQL